MQYLPETTWSVVSNFIKTLQNVHPKYSINVTPEHNFNIQN